MQIQPFVERDALAALGGALQLVERHDAAGGGGGFRFGQDGGLFFFAPELQAGEGGAGFVGGLGGAGGKGGCWAGAERGDFGAVVIFGDTVLEAVFSVAGCADHAYGAHGVDEGFAFGVGALCGG